MREMFFFLPLWFPVSVAKKSLFPISVCSVFIFFLSFFRARARARVRARSLFSPFLSFCKASLRYRLTNYLNLLRSVYVVSCAFRGSS